jgi:hypothetical protein
MIKGSCLCGGVRFQSGASLVPLNCATVTAAVKFLGRRSPQWRLNHTALKQEGNMKICLTPDPRVRQDRSEGASRNEDHSI